MFIRVDSASTLPNLPQTTGTQFNWDPSAISNIIFGSIMVFVGVVAIWQGRHRRVVALDEELAIIRPLHRPLPSFSHPYTESSVPMIVPAPQLMPCQSSMASLPATRLTLANNENNGSGQSTANRDDFIPIVSNRVTTLSTLESVENESRRNPHDTTPEFERAGLDGSTITAETVGDQGRDLSEMT